MNQLFCSKLLELEQILAPRCRNDVLAHPSILWSYVILPSSSSQNSEICVSSVYQKTWSETDFMRNLQDEDSQEDN